MMKVTLMCPMCGYGSVYDGHGICKCGAQLIHHWHGISVPIDRSKYAWIWVNGEPVLYGSPQKDTDGEYRFA